MKTNSRKAIDNIRDYIIKNFDCSSYSEYANVMDIVENNISNKFQIVSQTIFDCFYKEKVRFNKRKMGYRDLFIDWAGGLPSILDCCYYYNRSAVEDLGNILEKSSNERNKHTEDQAEKLLTYLIFREIVKFVDYSKYPLNFYY